MAYSTLADFRTITGIPDTKVPDAQVNDFIPIADSQIDKITGKTWGKFLHVLGQLHDATGYTTLRLRDYPVVAVVSISKYVNGSWELQDEWDPDTRLGTWRVKKLSSGIIEWVNSAPAKGTDNLKVIYEHGHSTTPDYIKDASVKIAWIAALQYDAGQVNPHGFQNVSEGALSVGFGSGAHDGQIKLLIQEVGAIFDRIGGRMEYAWSK